MRQGIFLTHPHRNLEKEKLNTNTIGGGHLSVQPGEAAVSWDVKCSQGFSEELSPGLSGHSLSPADGGLGWPMLVEKGLSLSWNVPAVLQGEQLLVKLRNLIFSRDDSN